MQTVNNNFTVEALVAKYRNFVDEHCPKESYWDPKEGNISGPFDPIDCYAEAHLLVTLYKRIAGENTDQNILEALSKYVAAFYTNALNEEEMDFLANHFSKVSTFIFNNFADKYTKGWISRPTQKVYEIIEKLKKVEAGKTIFIGGAGLCDMALLFPNCTIKGYSEYGFFEELSGDKEMWALGQIRLFAAGIKSEIKPLYEDTKNSQYMSDVDIAIFDTADRYSYPFSNGSEHLFQYMKPNSEFLLFLDKQNAAGNSMAGLTKMLVEKKCIYSIVSFEEPNTILSTTKTTICVRANKSTSDVVCIKNNATGEQMQLSTNMLDPTILWPSYYLTEKPKEGISLSEIVSFLDFRPKKKEDIVFKKTTFNDEKECIEWILSDKEKTIPVIAPINLSTGYEDAELYEAQLKQAGDPLFEKFLGWLGKISLPCVFCYGRKDKFVAGYIRKIPSEGIVAYRQLVCLVPKKGIDVRYVAALLLTPEVRNQIISICEGEVDAQLFPLIMDKIIVPSHTDLERATFLSEANYKAIGSSKKKMEDRLNEKKAEYINEVRMRKHDMRPHLRQMASSERLMLHYLDNINDIEDLKKLLKKQISTSHNALQSLSELVEHLSNEERFGEPECVNLNDYFHNIEKNSEVNFTIKVSCEKALAQRKKEIEELKEKNKKENVPSMQDMDEKTITECSLDVYIAPVDLDRIINNIIENARRHGGLSDGRKSDYYISIDVKIDYQRDMYQIDFSNNGKPLPKGMTKERYGLKGEKAGPNAGTGSGGYIVKSIVEHYGGDFDLFSTDGITTIRIYLPKYL
uniref:sensor histidine kinase n=1 Tax=Segatella hominis TaxID=2518605 RepID=UPI004038B3CC